MTLEMLRKKIDEMPAKQRWFITVFESITIQRPPDPGDDYNPEKLEAVYRENMQRCYDAGLSIADLRLLVDPKKIPADRWDRDIVAKLLKEE